MNLSILIIRGFMIPSGNRNFLGERYAPRRFCTTQRVVDNGIEFEITHVKDTGTTPKISPWGKTTITMRNPSPIPEEEDPVTITFEIETNKDGKRPRLKGIKH